MTERPGGSPCPPVQVVLGSGGVLGDAWMSGLLAGLLDAGGPDLRGASRFVGTSAGSIVATRLAAGVDLREYLERRLGHRGGDGVPAAGPDAGPGPLLRPAVPGRLAAGLLAAMAPGERLFRRAVLRAIPGGDQELARLGASIERMMPAWDERLRLVGVVAATGERLVFSGDEPHGLTVSEAVRASCAIPGVYRPVDSSRGPVVDGGVWSPVNVDAVEPPPGAAIVCLYPSGYLSRPLSPRRVMMAGVSRTRAGLEAARAGAVGARVLTVGPDPESARAIGPDRMRPEREPEAAATGFRQGLSLAPRLGAWLAAG